MYDAAARERMREDVRNGLSQPQKEIPPVYFYDERGSELFEEITRQPEYYLTETERGLLRLHMPAWVRETGSRALVELGAGNADKTRVILDAMVEAGTGELYVPVDVSADFLEASTARLAAEYPTFALRPAVADMTRPVEIRVSLPDPALFALLGSTLGNFEDEAAIDLLSSIARKMRIGDRLLLGVDLRKEAARIEAAYNDVAGVTAEFNRNVLRVMNRELEADFLPESFAHHAFYDRAEDRIEMHLVSDRAQTVNIPGAGRFSFREGETIRTEISAKYDRPRVEKLFAASGLALSRWAMDDDGLYAIALATSQRAD